MLGRRKRKIDMLITRLAALSAILIAALLVSANARLFSVFAQTTEELQVSASFTDKQVAPVEPIEFRFNRPLVKAEGTLAIIIGQSDLSALFTLSDKSLRYDAKALPLPQGESIATVYLVSTGNVWKEVAKFTLRVGLVAVAQQEQKPAEQPQQQAAGQPQKRFGFEKLNLIPSISLSLSSQPAQSNFPASNRPARATFTDLNGQMSFKSEVASGLFNSQTQFDLVGSSFQQTALRFGQLGQEAPQLDLSSYLMQFQVGKLRYQAGHFSFGTSRHLMNGFSSRGMMITVPLGNRADFSLSAMNGTSIVGYGNFFGIDKRRHQLLSGTLGFEMQPERPGGLRIEVSALNGWVQPLNSFSQGSVNDAERSRGFGFRLLATDPAGRFKLDTGMARSQFTSPSDPLVNQGREIEPFPSITRNARYLDASYDILKALALTKEKRVNLSLAFRHEQVDPLYRSLGASTQADKVSNDFSLTGSIGEISTQFAHLRFNDNLKEIPSILKSLTRGNTFNLSVPLSSIIGDAQKPTPFWPRLSYNFNRIHQFGAAIPVRGGFELDPASVPDQVGTVQGLSADWQIEKWRVGYRLNHSFQNNRQPLAAKSDFANLINGFTVGVSASKSLELNLDINRESAHSLETATIDRTLRFAPGINWQMMKQATFSSTISTTLAGDAAETKRNRNIEFDTQWAYRFGFEKDRFRKMQGQFFIRYANRYARARNFPISLNDLQKTQIVNTGLSLNLF
jgi:hypothetical protein